MEPLKNLPRRSLVLDLVLQLKERISKTIYTAGEKLPTEKQLHLETGVSRTVIREAVSRLAAEGWVEPRQGSGVYVLEQRPKAQFDISPEEIDDISDFASLLELRISVEADMAAFAAKRRNEADIDKLYHAYEDIDKQIALGDDAVKEDALLHRAISEASHNPYYPRFIAFLGARLVPPRVLGTRDEPPAIRRNFLEKVQSEHLEIIEAIKKGDAEAASSAVKKHLNNAELRHRLSSHTKGVML